jgi:uncharacterized protein (TIGR03084 family)
VGSVHRANICSIHPPRQGHSPWAHPYAADVDDTLVALAAQQNELADVLGALTDGQWRAPTRCVGWDVADVVLHLAQSDAMAVASAGGRFLEYLREQSPGAGPAGSVDESAARMVERERGADPGQLLARWRAGATELIDVLGPMDLSTRVSWVAGELAARTLATTRLAETWIHAGDVADAVGVHLAPTARLRLIARLAWRTLPYAFAAAGRAMTGPVSLHLVGPDGDRWDFEPDAPASTTVSGPAAELCAVAARRVDPSSTTLRGVGPDAAAVLSLIRTYA